MNKVSGLILAAGQGSRMNSNTPKGLHKIKGKPMVERIVDTFTLAGIDEICLVLNPDTYEQFLPFCNNACLQLNPLGTAHAVGAAAEYFQQSTPSYCTTSLVRGTPTSNQYVVMSPCDSPNISASVLENFYRICLDKNVPLGVIGAHHPDPFGYGRMIVENNELIKIVEEKDANEETKKITLCHTCVIFADTSVLFRILNLLSNDNVQKEYHISHIFEVGRQLGFPTYVYETNDYQSFLGVNSKEQLKNLEKVMKK